MMYCNQKKSTAAERAQEAFEENRTVAFNRVNLLYNKKTKRTHPIRISVQKMANNFGAV